MLCCCKHLACRYMQCVLQVGPGSYTLPNQTKARYPSYVPFSTSTERGFDSVQTSAEVRSARADILVMPAFHSCGRKHEATSLLSGLLQYNPGPGEYSWAPSTDSQAQRPSTSFVSNVSRLHERRCSSALCQRKLWSLAEKAQHMLNTTNFSHMLSLHTSSARVAVHCTYQLCTARRSSIHVLLLHQLKHLLFTFQAERASMLLCNELFLHMQTAVHQLCCMPRI